MTSLAPDPGMLGALSAQAILSRIRGEPVSGQKLPWKLVQRKST